MAKKRDFAKFTDRDILINGLSPTYHTDYGQQNTLLISIGRRFKIVPFVAIPSTVKLAIVGTAESQQIVSVLHYKYVGTAPTSAALTVFINAWLGLHKTSWLACMGVQYTMQHVDCTDLSVSSGNFATVVVGGPSNVGTGGGSALPGNVALALSWRTGVAGRRNRGRTFFGPLSDNQVDNSIATSAFLTALTTLASQLISQTYSGGFDFAVASYADHAAKIITGVVIEAITDSMRRRLPGRGI